MKVVLQKDVKNVGKAGDMVSVKDGFARNFLFPRRLAVEATDTRVRAWEHIKKVAEVKKKKAMADRKELIEKIKGTTLTFQRVAGESDKIFGTVTPHDVSTALEARGISVDRRDIECDGIKVLGQHKAKVDLGDNLTADLVISVEKTIQ
jgi:large subunit ribosomal protein L9